MASSPSKLTLVPTDLLLKFPNHMNWEGAYDDCIESYDLKVLAELVGHPHFPRKPLFVQTANAASYGKEELFGILFASMTPDERVEHGKILFQEGASGGNFAIWQSLRKDIPLLNAGEFTGLLDKSIIGGSVDIFRDIRNVANPEVSNDLWENFYSSAALHHPEGPMRIEILHSAPLDVLKDERAFFTAAIGWTPPPQPPQQAANG